MLISIFISICNEYFHITKIIRARSFETMCNIRLKPSSKVSCPESEFLVVGPESWVAYPGSWVPCPKMWEYEALKSVTSMRVRQKSNVEGVTKCDKKLFQSVTGITKCDNNCLTRRRNRYFLKLFKFPLLLFWAE